MEGLIDQSQIDMILIITIDVASVLALIYREIKVFASYMAGLIIADICFFVQRLINVNYSVLLVCTKDPRLRPVHTSDSPASAVCYVVLVTIECVL